MHLLVNRDTATKTLFRSLQSMKSGENTEIKYRVIVQNKSEPSDNYHGLRLC